MQHAAQPTPPPADDLSRRVDLVLEGGGVKGIALAGAIEVLEERGYVVNRVAGSSAGAIAGALAAAGISGREMVEILRGTDYRAFADGPWWTRTLPGAALAIATRLGIHRTDALRTWLAQQLEDHGAPPGGGTFEDLAYRDPDPARELPAHQRHRLAVTASDLTAGRLRVLPADAEEYGLDPERLSVVDAVLASVSIPFFFRPSRWRNRHGRTSYLVDGGMLSNFPVSLFDLPVGEMPRWPTLGIKLSARPETDFGVVNEITGPLSFTRAVVDTVTGFYDRMHIEDSHAVARTIFIDTDAVRPTEFDLSRERAELLYQEGRRGALEFLDGTPRQEPWDFARYVERFRRGCA